MSGHGTFAAGIIGAVTDNREGIAAVAPDAQVLVIKAMDAAGSASTDDLAASVDYAIGAGAGVINLGLGSETHVNGLSQPPAGFR